MIEVKFTTPVTDKNTQELYLKDKVVSFPEERAKELVDFGVAEYVAKPGGLSTKEEKNFK